MGKVFKKDRASFHDTFRAPPPPTKTMCFLCGLAHVDALDPSDLDAINLLQIGDRFITSM